MKHVDAVIIGGGVIGCSIAYHMAKSKRRVVVLEQQKTGSQSSGAAAGMLAVQAEGLESSPLYPLAKQSRDRFPDLAQELKELSGIDIGLVGRGMLKPAFSEREAQRLQAEAAHIQRTTGDGCEWLSAEETRKREDKLADSVVGAMYIPQDGQVSAPDLTKAFASAAAALGADIAEYAGDVRIIREGGRIQGVRTAEETYVSETVIAAAGAWSAQLLAPLGVNLPIYPVKGECLSVISPVRLLQATVFAEGCYLVPKSGGRLVIGATMVERSFDKKVSAGGIATLLKRASEILPDIVHAEWESAWAGLRPQTDDGLPFLGEHPAIKGLIVAAGHFRNGILLSPVTGALVADLANGASARQLGIEAFALDRGMSAPREAGAVQWN